MTNPVTFHEWLASAAPGSRHVYYIGSLAADRGDCMVYPPKAFPTPDLIEADAAWSAAEAGLVSLIQRAIKPRLANGTHPAFHYIAQRTSKVRSA